MESLAVLVAILFLIDIFAGPFAILLTWAKLVDAINSQSRSIALTLTIIRRSLHGLFATVGVLIGGWLTYLAVTPAKLFGLFSLITSYIALRREYFPDIYIVRFVLLRLGIKKDRPQVFSADGTEIIPAKRSRRLGRSSGRDSHGPGGQH